MCGGKQLPADSVPVRRDVNKGGGRHSMGQWKGPSHLLTWWRDGCLQSGFGHCLSRLGKEGIQIRNKGGIGHVGIVPSQRSSGKSVPLWTKQSLRQKHWFSGKKRPSVPKVYWFSSVVHWLAQVAQLGSAAAHLFSPSAEIFAWESHLFARTAQLFARRSELFSPVAQIRGGPSWF